MSKKELEKQVKAISRGIKSGDVIHLMYDGESIAEYNFIEWSYDSKTPMDWLRGCLRFEVRLKGRDIKNVSLKYHQS